MSASFSSVDSAEQQRLLDSHWDRLRSPELVPALREMAAPWPEERGSKQMGAAYRGSPQATALFRWYEVDPECAYEEILRQIGSAQPTLYADAIDFLPAKSLPQFEEIWTKSLMQAATEDRQGVLLSLMARFGTGASVPAVREALNGKIGVLDCREQSAALAYLVRFDEAGASGVIEAAVAARGEDKTGCNRTVFTDVGHYVSNKGLIAEAVKALDDPAVDVKLDALNYLAGYGDRDCRAAAAGALPGLE